MAESQIGGYQKVRGSEQDGIDFERPSIFFCSFSSSRSLVSLSLALAKLLLPTIFRIICSKLT